MLKNRLGPITPGPKILIIPDRRELAVLTLHFTRELIPSFRSDVLVCPSRPPPPLHVSG